MCPAALTACVLRQAPPAAADDSALVARAALRAAAGARAVRLAALVDTLQPKDAVESR